MDAAPPELIVATALSDGDHAVRVAAVQKLPDGEPLRKLAGLGADPAPFMSLEKPAQQRLAQLIDSGTVDWAALGAASGNTAALLGVAGFSSNPTLVEDIVAAIHDPQQRSQLVMQGHSLQVRQLAAHRIDDPQELRRLLKLLQGKDKSVYRILKDKRDALRAEEQRRSQLEADVLAACASLENLSRHVHDPLFVPTFEHFEARWRALEHQATSELRERAGQAIDRCRGVINEQMRERTKHLEAASQETARRAAREAAAVQAGEDARQRESVAALAAAEEALRREAEARARAERLATEARAARQIGALVAKAPGALRTGHTRPAAGLRRAIEEKLIAIPALPPTLVRAMQELDTKLEELKAWKDYAVAPKRTELIADMEALIGSSEPPKALADRIRDLRAHWKTISQGIVVESDADWQRFNRAARSAYQPCREYFEAQARARTQNLERRKSVLDRLLAFEAAQVGELPDFQMIAHVLDEAPQEWRRISPVDRDALVPVREAFAASLGRLQARLDAWYLQNAAAKQSLIQQAQALVAMENSRDAAEAAKALQQQWQAVAAVRRDQERPLWNEFRRHCDAIFQKRQQAYSEYAAGLEISKAKAVALCEETEQFAAQSGPVLLDGAAKLPDWRAAFEALGDLPRADERRLYERFERALKRCQAAVATQRVHDTEQSFINLLESARHINVYRWSVARQAPTADCEACKLAAETFIAGVPVWPKGSLAAIKEAWAKADVASDRDAFARESALRTLCLRSEILSGLPTPPEDQALRREYQLQRLVQGMGHGSAANADDWEAMAFDWLRIGAVAPDQYDALLARFLLGRRNGALRALESSSMQAADPRGGGRIMRATGYGKG